MMKSSPSSGGDEAVREAAARWTVRRDRGLSATEAIEFELWLAADARHATAMQRSAGAWGRLDRIPEAIAQRELAQAARQRRWRRWGLSLAALGAAAAISLIAWRQMGGAMPSDAPALVAEGPRVVTLADGTVVRLNEASEVVEAFTPTERRVRLTRGEAYFSVTKNPARPFIVSAGTVQVRAVGTAFDVNFQTQRVEVLVTEGKVRLANASQPQAAPSLVAAGERAVLSAPQSTNDPVATVAVTKVTRDEIARVLAWHETLLRLGGSTLAEIASEFERRTGEHVLFADPELAQLRVGGRFRADDIDGFASLLETTYDIEVGRPAAGTLVLRKKSLSR